MKAVLPALTVGGYESLAIRDGDTASREYLRVTFGNVKAEERDRVRRQLEEYCGLDTQGMWQIVSALRNLWPETAKLKGLVTQEFAGDKGVGWPTGLEPATSRATVWGSTIELWPPLDSRN
jgi:hypothetical protein